MRPEKEEKRFEVDVLMHPMIKGMKYQVRSQKIWPMWQRVARPKRAMKIMAAALLGWYGVPRHVPSSLARSMFAVRIFRCVVGEKLTG
jgi:hypothetical protein